MAEVSRSDGLALPAGARLIAAAQVISAAWERLARDIDAAIVDRDAVLVGVLMGGMVPLVEIARRMKGDFVLDYCHLSRYRDAQTGGVLHWIAEPHERLAARTVVLVDDICDQGDTLAALRDHCVAAGAEKVLIAVLARKRHSRGGMPVEPDFIGLEVDDRYVFGCGMDLEQRWRHLPALYALE